MLRTVRPRVKPEVEFDVFFKVKAKRDGLKLRLADDMGAAVNVYKMLGQRVTPSSILLKAVEFFSWFKSSRC